MRKLVYAFAATLTGLMLVSTPAFPSGMAGAFAPAHMPTSVGNDHIQNVNYRYRSCRHHWKRYSHMRGCVAARHYYRYYAYPYDYDYFNYGYGPPVYYGMPFFGFSFGFNGHHHHRMMHRHMGW